MIYIPKIRRQVLPLLLITTILISTWLPLFSPAPVQANDRAAAIIGSQPMQVPGIVTPSGLTGKGQIIGIADSGLDKGSMTNIHPDLQSLPNTMPKVTMLRSYTDREVPDDPTGHGTHMAATIAGTGKASGGKYHGIAPGASIYFQALLNRSNQLQLPEQLSSLFRPAYEAGVRIHVNGWGSGSNVYGIKSSQIDDFVYKYNDFLPVFAAGNTGPGSRTLTSEANSKNALVVGYSQVPRPAFGPDARYADKIAESSSRGPAGNGRIKPELLAPGSAVISACSSLVSSNYAADPAYTRLGGSSMAAAVTGGALAVLREELKSDKNITNPSAALMKSLLINGARTNTGDKTREGFGILDLAGTILALKEDNFQFIDETFGIKKGESTEYHFEVSDSSTPVKVTLAWTDPAGKTGAAQALVSNLDLTVEAPGGKTYYGNDFYNQGKIDNINNVEQVVIPNPKPGEYTIRVRGADITGSSSSQSFALAYGQPLRHEIVQSADADRNITVAGGDKINLNELQIYHEIDGTMVSDKSPIEPGSDLYLASKTAYLFGSTWQTGGIQALATDDGDLLLEMNNQAREGGYYLDERASTDDNQNITVNNQKASGITAIPSGVELKASINPFYQTIWKLKASGKEISGYVEKVDTEKREIKLLHNLQMYKVADWAAITYRDKLTDCTTMDTPFGSTRANNLENLMPGTKVTLLVAPTTSIIQYLQVERPMVIGKVTAIGQEQGKISLDTGKEYQILSGSALYRDHNQVSLSEIEIGDSLMGQLIPESNTIIQAQVYSRVLYGRVTYYSTKQNRLYFTAIDNHACNIELNNNSQVFAWGIPVDASTLTSGSWVRVITDPEGVYALNIDMAAIADSARETIVKYDPKQETLQTNNARYSINSATRISKGGYSIAPQDIRPGEKADIVTLMTPSPWPQVLANIELDVDSRAEIPTLEISANSLNGVLVVQGSTSADVIYLYRQDGSRERIDVQQGKFSRLLDLLDNEKQIQALAFDTRTGGITAKTYDITVYPVKPIISSFKDTADHWAQPYIEDLGKRGIISGCGDQTFNPDSTISRSELVTILTRAEKLDWNETINGGFFRDNGDIPWWSLKAVLTASEHGLVKGYPDGTFRPLEPITRSELAVIIYNLIKTDKTESPSAKLPYADTSTIPMWAQDAFSYLYQEKLLRMWYGMNLQPLSPVTRAEAAAIIDLIIDE